MQVPIRICDRVRQQHLIIWFHRLLHLGKSIRHQPTDSLRCVDRSIHVDVADVDALRGELGGDALREHAACAHSGGVGVLAGVATVGGGGRGVDDGPLAARHHVRRDLLCQRKRPDRAHRQGQVEDAVGGLLQGAGADLRTDVVHGDLDGADVTLDGFDQLGSLLRHGAVAVYAAHRP